MNDIELRAISLENLDQMIDLRVKPEQAALVADNLYSIAQAGLDPFGQCRAAYLDGKAIGFVYSKLLNEARLMYICRFMVDGREQGRGLGRKIMAKLLASAFESPSLELADLAVARDPGNAEAFYSKCGFIPTGEEYKGGWRMVLHRARFLLLESEQSWNH